MEQAIPKADEWDAEAERDELGVESVKRMVEAINCFKVDQLPNQIQRAEQGYGSFQTSLGGEASEIIRSGDEVSQIRNIGRTILQRGDNITKNGNFMSRVGKLRMLAGCAVLRVAEFREDGMRKVAKRINKQTSDFLFGTIDEHQCRKMRDFASFWCWAMEKLPGWKGRELALYLQLTESKRNLTQLCYKPTIPALAGEFVATMEAKGHHPNSPEIPGLICIVENLLAGIVGKDIIYRALGCPYIPQPQISDHMSITFIDNSAGMVTAMNEGSSYASAGHTSNCAVENNHEGYDSHNNAFAYTGTSQPAAVFLKAILMDTKKPDPLNCNVAFSPTYIGHPTSKTTFS
ncbi:hypothetical protein OCU04_007893 [Sclerotinia nivalis]|uniref:Uncharacterized protein n=1 Tax=Sclerotinia nivalis TaxID=352851 RepID=A0A9X0DKG1_9HELO|nr:hypothetical protein OCU04_007893 [Sclerotinia nivalis]